MLGYEQSPYPSLADAFYLMYPVGAGVAVVLLSTSNTGRSRIRLVLDGLIVAASLFVVSWISVIENVFRAVANLIWPWRCRWPTQSPMW